MSVFVLLLKNFRKEEGLFGRDRAEVSAARARLKAARTSRGQTVTRPEQLDREKSAQADDHTSHSQAHKPMSQFFDVVRQPWDSLVHSFRGLRDADPRGRQPMPQVGASQGDEAAA